jgi:hypothetical protein
MNHDDGFDNSGQAFEADIDAITALDEEITEEEKEEE